MRRDLAPFADRVSFIWSNDRSFADILKQAASLPPHSAIFWHLMNVDAAGIVYEGNTALSRLYAVANAPIFTYDDSYFGEVIVGGPMHSVLSLSRETVAVAIRILGGEKAGDIKIAASGYATPIFDWRQMQRWGISESRLPPGSQIHFREPVCGSSTSCRSSGSSRRPRQAALIAWLIYEHRRRWLAEVRSRNAMAELASMNRLATAGQLSASIAHEINQPVTGMVLRASAALRWLPEDMPDVEKVRDVLTEIVGRVSGPPKSLPAFTRCSRRSANAKVVQSISTT